MTETTTDWIAPGAEVLVYVDSVSPMSVTASRRTTVAKVAAKSFTVVGLDERFNLATQSTKFTGGSFSSSRWVAVPVDSDEARSIEAKEATARKLSSARGAVNRWERNRTRENRLAAIDALQRVED